MSGRCVLTLHRVVDRPERDHDLAWPHFRALLDSLAGRGLPVSTELDDPRSAPGSVTLTFDDGTEDHLPVAEELARRSLAGVFYLPVDLLGDSGRLEPGEIPTLVALGHAVGSHTLDHRRLAGLAEDELRHQLTESKRRLEARAGTTVASFAPPGGVGHPALARVLEAAGYTSSRSTRWGFYRSREQRWAVPCLPVTEFTWRRGWIERALTAWELPPVMRMAWQVKRRMPAVTASRVRARLTSRA